MIYPISRISGSIYRRIIKPLLFLEAPDDAHEQMIRFGAISQKFRPLRGFVRGCWDYENREVLSQNLAGLNYKNPLGLSAGLDKNFSIMNMISAIGFGQAEGGSITFRECLGNPKPWFFRLPKTKSIVVHAGLPNVGAEEISRRVSLYDKRDFRDMLLNVSIAKSNIRETATDVKAGVDEYVAAAKIITKLAQVSVITLNISCPNAFGGEIFTAPKPLEHLLAAIDKLKLKQPVFIKMPGNESDDEFRELLKVISKHHIAGVTIANLHKSRIAVKKEDELTDEIEGNLSGAPCFDRGNQLIALAFREFGDKLVISGVGGVFSAEDAYVKIRAGASLVQMVTGLMFEGPQIVGQINRGLGKLLRRDGFANISQAVGVDAKKYEQQKQAN